MSFISSRIWACREMFRSLKRDWELFTLAILLSSFALSIPIFVGSILYDLAAPARAIPTNAEITIFLNKKVKPETLAESMLKLPDVITTTIIPKEEAVKSLNQRLGIQDLSKVDNPLPDILVLTLSNNVSESRIKTILDDLDKNKNVDMVAFDHEWLRKFHTVSHAIVIAVGTMGVAGSLLVIFVLLMVVRLATHAIDPVMKTLYLFGASPMFAIRPWAWRGALLMGLSSAIALCLATLAISFLKPSIEQIATLYQSSLTLHFPETYWSLGFVLCFCALGAVTSSISAYRVWKRAQRLNSLI
ncbi:MAG: permease-like cell division protein FtsX [Sutterella wadsworthensis]|jgi:cell division protein ftsX|nr:permease-like cell division protein FtsX [Sutterella wadsworthensis]MDU5053684.1 permease-like cell division protein FtsX [Sutterella wadsworthensis]